MFAENQDDLYIYSMSPDHPDFPTVTGFLQGDSAATREIESMVDAAFRVWKGKFGYESDDVRADILMKLLISLRRGDYQYRARLKTYVNRVVNHSSIDVLRFNKRFAPEDIDDLNLPSNTLSPEELMEKRQTGRLTFRVLRMMSRECLQLWRMHLKHNLKYSEIANIMGKSEGNIRRRFWECRKRAIEVRARLVKKDKPF